MCSFIRRTQHNYQDMAGYHLGNMRSAVRTLECLQSTKSTKRHEEVPAIQLLFGFDNCTKIIKSLFAKIFQQSSIVKTNRKTMKMYYL